MTSGQKKLVMVLSVLVGAVFVAVAVIAVTGARVDVTGSPGTVTSTTAATTATTTSTTAPSTSTTGPSTTTSSTSTSTTTSSTTTTTEAPSLTLRGDGLGEVTFGTEAEAAITRLTGILGPPAEDAGWEPSFSGFGTCPGEQVRGVRWGTLWALFTDGETEWRSDGTRHFFTYLNSVFYDESTSLGLLTEDGVGLGDGLARLRDTYGSRVAVFYDEFFETYVFSVEWPEPGVLWGTMTGDQPTSLITTIEGGRGCGE